MVAIVVYFESIHRASAHAAQSAACADATAAAATAADANSVASPAAAPSMDELRLRYQQGLDLLLNAADLEQPCMAIFNEYESITAEALEEALGPSLLKKFKQLELYEVPCYACVANPAAAVDIEDTVDAEDSEGAADAAADADAVDGANAERAGKSCTACTEGDGVVLESATAKVFDFVQTVGFEREFEILQEANVKTFTM